MYYDYINTSVQFIIFKDELKNLLSLFDNNIFVVECYFNFFTYPVNGGKNVVTFSTRHLCVLNFMLHSLHAPVIPRSAI